MVKSECCNIKENTKDVIDGNLNYTSFCRLPSMMNDGYGVAGISSEKGLKTDLDFDRAKILVKILEDRSDCNTCLAWSAVTPYLWLCLPLVWLKIKHDSNKLLEQIDDEMSKYVRVSYVNYNIFGFLLIHEVQNDMHDMKLRGPGQKTDIKETLTILNRGMGKVNGYYDPDMFEKELEENIKSNRREDMINKIDKFTSAGLNEIEINEMHRT